MWLLFEMKYAYVNEEMLWWEGTPRGETLWEGPKKKVSKQQLERNRQK